jgi:VanZ family protein
LYNGELPESLLVGQWKSALLLRTPTHDLQARRKFRETGVEGALQRNRQRFIAITSGPQGTLFYVDGELADSNPKVFVRPEDLRGRLVIGDSPRGGSGWNGKLFGLAAFNRPLDAPDILRHFQLWTGRRGGELATEDGVAALYLFEMAAERTIPDQSPSRNPLLIPASYYDVHKTVLSPPWALESLHWDDITINILGFIPFGFFCFAYRAMLQPGRYFGNAFLVSLAGGLISAFIELSQVFIPTRDSSLTDLICNILGAILGVILAISARKLAASCAALPGPLKKLIARWP